MESCLGCLDMGCGELNTLPVLIAEVLAALGTVSPLRAYEVLRTYLLLWSILLAQWAEYAIQKSGLRHFYFC